MTPTTVRLLRIILAFVAVAAPAKAMAQFTIEQSLAAAYLNNPTIATAGAALTATRERTTQARAQMLPNVEAALNAQTVRGTPPEPGSAQNLVGATVTVEQPLFQGGVLVNGVRAAELQVASAEASFSALLQQVFLQVAVAHADLWRDARLVALTSQMLALTEDRVAAVRIQFEAGGATRTALAQAEAQLAVIRSNHAIPTANLSMSAASYTQLAGIEPPHVSIVHQAISLPGSLAAVEAIALETHPSLMAARFRSAAADTAVDIARGEFLPDVGVFAQIGTQRDFMGNQDWEPEATVGVRLTIPLYTGGATRSTVRQADNQALQAEMDENARRAAIIAELYSAYAQWQAGTTQVAFARQLVEASNAALEATRAAAAEGVLTEVAVIDAHLELISAQISDVEARHAEFIAQYRVLAAIGQLDPAHLDLPI